MFKNSAVKIFFGPENIKSIYRRALKEKRVDFICLAKSYDDVLGNWFDNEYSRSLYGKVKTREILPDTNENRKFAESKDKKINQVKFTKRERSETDVLCGVNWVALISYDSNQPLTVVIEEEELAKALKQQFEEEWRSL